MEKIIKDMLDNQAKLAGLVAELSMASGGVHHAQLAEEIGVKAEALRRNLVTRRLRGNKLVYENEGVDSLPRDYSPNKDYATPVYNLIKEFVDKNLTGFSTGGNFTLLDVVKPEYLTYSTEYEYLEKALSVASGLYSIKEGVVILAHCVVPGAIHVLEVTIKASLFDNVVPGVRVITQMQDSQEIFTHDNFAVFSGMDKLRSKFIFALTNKTNYKVPTKTKVGVVVDLYKRLIGMCGIEPTIMTDQGFFVLNSLGTDIQEFALPDSNLSNDPLVTSWKDLNAIRQEAFLKIIRYMISLTEEELGAGSVPYNTTVFVDEICRRMGRMENPTHVIVSEDVDYQVVLRDLAKTHRLVTLDELISDTEALSGKFVLILRPDEVAIKNLRIKALYQYPGYIYQKDSDGEGLVYLPILEPSGIKRYPSGVLKGVPLPVSFVAALLNAEKYVGDLSTSEN